MPSGVLFDIDGTLRVGGELLPGAQEVVRSLEDRRARYAFLSNTTSVPADELEQELRDLGLPQAVGRTITPAEATERYLEAEFPRATCFFLGEGHPFSAASRLRFVNDAEERPDVVVLGGAGPCFSHERVSQILRLLLRGARLVAMHCNMLWQRPDGLHVDTGVYLRGLEAAADTRAVVIGKPSAKFFLDALSRLGLPATEVMMVGDDLENDVVAAESVGLTTALMLTGKPPNERRGVPERSGRSVLDSLLELPAILDRQA